MSNHSLTRSPLIHSLWFVAQWVLGVLRRGVASASLVPLILAGGAARADAPAGGGIAGVVKDAATGEALWGVTVVVLLDRIPGSSPKVVTTITNEEGHYNFLNLPTGAYTVTFYYNDSKQVAYCTVADQKIALVNHSFAVTRGYTSSTFGQGGDPVHDIRRQGHVDFTTADGELEVSGGLTFVAGRDPAPSGETIRFTDIDFLRGQIAYSPKDKVRLALAVTALIKQPGTTHSIFDNASLGARVRLAQSWAATVAGSHSSLMGKRGNAQTAAAGVLGRSRVNSWLVWEAGANAQAMFLRPTGAPMAWLLETTLHAASQFCFGPCEKDYGAAWIAADAGLPLAHRSGVDLTPTTHLSLSTGARMPVSNRYSMYVTFAWLDRGTAALPGSQLPLLDGGFDQTQLTFGVIWNRN